MATKLLKFHVIAPNCPLKRKTYCDRCQYNNGWDTKTYCHYHDKDWIKIPSFKCNYLY